MAKHSILIVEDEVIVAEDLRSKLTQLGYDIVGVTGSGAEARAIALERQPSIVLMDIHLSGQLDGIQTAESIQRDRDVPVIYLTAHSDPATLNRAKLTGPFGYVIKPFGMRDLATQIELALHRHKSDRQVREHREWLRVTLTSIGDGVIAIDAKGQITFINPVAASLTGWQSDAAVGKPVEDVFRLINERTGQPVESPVAQVMRERRVVPLANHSAIITRDGHIVPIEDSAAPIIDADGRLIGVVLVFHDVTEKRRTEREQRRLRNLMAEAEKLANIGAWELDLTSQRWSFSDQWLAIHGCPHGSLSTDQRLAVVHPDDRATVRAAIDKVCSGASDYDIEHRIVRLDNGQVRHVYGYGHFATDDQGRVAKIHGFTRDITEYKLAELERRSAMERHVLLATVAERLLRSDSPQTIAEDLRELVMPPLDCQFFFHHLADDAGKRMQLNAYAGIPEDTAEEIRRLDFDTTVCGWAAREGRPLIVEDVQNCVDPWMSAVKRLGTKAYCCHPLIMQDRLIGALSFGTTTRPVFADEELQLMKAVCDQVLVAMQRLLTQKELHVLNQTLELRVAERTRLAEARARQLQALAIELIETEERERRRFADYLHDDLQQLLAAAKMHLESFCEVQPTKQALSHVSQMIKESIDKSRRLSRELSPPILNHTSLVAALEWLTKYFDRQFGLRVDLSIQGEDFSEVNFFKDFLFRAAQELLFNVVKHSQVNRARIDLSKADGMVVLTVSDLGRGMDPGSLDSPVGLTGVGLLSLRERARYMGGSLRIESQIGKGSRFTLTVPCNIATMDEPVRTQIGRHDVLVKSSHAEPSDTRILFVDDHKVMRQGLINLIGSQPGIQVAGEAANGWEAIDLVQALKPDLVVMDVSMPIMDGIEATRHIKANWPQVRVIALSMTEDEQIARTMREAGAEAFVSKTASSADLLKAIYGLSRAE